MRAVRALGACIAALGIAVGAAVPSQAWSPGHHRTHHRTHHGVRNVTLARIAYDGRAAGRNGEYVKLTNHHSYPVDLRGWTLTEQRDGHRYVFPGKRLAPGGSVWLYSGRGWNSGANLYWWASGDVWKASGDRAVLRNGRGTVIDTCGWNRRGPGVTDCRG